MNNKPVAELVLEQMAVGDASSLRVNWLTDSYPPVGTLLYTHPVKELTQNITGVWRLSDQSIKIVFTSCRSASEFMEILRKANEK